ncbi:MAG: DUF3798 domain-containing protein [Firmicutes bacterium]|nr:DUF3798 domain-containing protein [Bacillota bacterium]
MSKRKKWLFKSFGFLLFAVLLLPLVACGSSTNQNQAGDWKLGIMATSPEMIAENPFTQAGSDGQAYFMAKQMQAEFGEEHIIIVSPPNRYMAEQETTMNLVTEMAEDPAVKAIIIAPGIPGTYLAISTAREIRPDLLFIVGSPGETQQSIAHISDIALATDYSGRVPKIIENARAMGAETIVHYTRPASWVSPDSVEALKLNAEAQGLQFVEVTTPASGSVDSPERTPQAHDRLYTEIQSFVSEDVPKKIADYGPSTAIIGNGFFMLEAMLTQTMEHGGIFPAQTHDTGFGYSYWLPEALGIEVPENKQAEIPWIHQEVNQLVLENGWGGRIATWPIPPNMLFVQAGTYYAIDWIDGKIEDRNNKAALLNIMEEISGVPVGLSEYPGTDNYYLYLSEPIIFGR